MRKIKYTKELLEPIVIKNITLKGVITDLGLSYSNGSSAGIGTYIRKYGIDTSHFIFKGNNKFIPNNDLFVENSKSDRTTVRGRIIKNNLIPYKCDHCGCNDEWMGKKMPFILDHKNGINDDNRLENLRFLCSNCDSIQDTYKSKNVNSSKNKIKTRKAIEKLNNKFEVKLQKQNIQINIINQIINSNIDFTKNGWRLVLGDKLNWTPQYAGIFVKKYVPEVWNICFKHVDRK